MIISIVVGLYHFAMSIDVDTKHTTRKFDNLNKNDLLDNAILLFFIILDFQVPGKLYKTFTVHMLVLIIFLI